MTRLRFLGDVSLFSGLVIAILAGGLCYWLYRQETLRTGSKYGRLLPWLRSIAVAWIVLILTGPTLRHRWPEGNPETLKIIIDDSSSMSLSDGEDSNRFARAVESLLVNDADFLPNLGELFEVEVVRASNRQPDPLWSSTLSQQMELPESTSAWLPDEYGDSTALGDLLDHDSSAVVVLMTDGRINDGSSLIEAAQRGQMDKRRIYTVGFGRPTAPPDLAIDAIEHPDRLFHRDTLTGKVQLRDTMPIGKSFRLQAWHQDSLAWEQRLATDGNGQRSIAFSFPMESLVAKASKSDKPITSSMNIEVAAVPIELEFRIVDLEDDAQLENNLRRVHLWGDLHRARILLIDGRSRWETRYLKNLFERDPYWEINAVIAEPSVLVGRAERLPSGKEPGEFPDSRDDLMEYDLVIIGEIAPGGLTPIQQKWMVDFVSESGGGLIVIDGSREAWMAPELGTLGSLLPVRRNASQPPPIDQRIRVELTAAGRSQSAFDISEVNRRNSEEQWKSLSPIHWIADTEVIPGSEVLAEGIQSPDSNERLPMFATRLAGAGRVFYSASDELWRWRYKVADQFHTRLWNQIARWMMRSPYSIKSDFVSLDAGRMTYAVGQEIEIRCRLKRDERTPLVDADVEALIQQDGEQVLALALTPDSEVPGVYRGSAAHLPPGNYRVTLSASGVPRDALAVHTQFVVAESTSLEMNETTCDRDTLRRVAELTGGKYFPENDLTPLLEDLRPLSQGRIIESETILWQSYAWFLPVVACLSIEWWLRKRAGLI